jgi:hypothetical protein
MESKLKKILKNILATAFTLVIIGTTQVYATTKQTVVYVPTGASNYAQVSATKSTNKRYVGYNLFSVCPTGNYTDDSYTKVKISAYFSSVTLLSERVVTEGTGYDEQSYSNPLKKDALITFRIKGNNAKLDAYASVYLNFF